MGELGIAIITALASLVADQQATLLFVGDAMMHAKQIEVALDANGQYNYDACFKNIAPLIKEADYAVVNLETPLASAPYSGYPMFNAPDTYAKALKDAGFDLFLTANNHTLDRRDRGLKRTIDVLNSLNVDHIGTYRDAADRDSLIGFVKDIKGFKIGFLNYTYGTNGITIQDDAIVNYIDKNTMRQNIAQLRNDGAELICVAIHWGDEYKLLPNAYQKDIANFLKSQGVDMIIGGHPHVIQPMELINEVPGKNQLLIYSLGNFISNMTTTDTRGGAIARVHIKRDAKGKAYVDSADYDLVFTIPGSKGGDNFTLVYADSCDNQMMKAKCEAFSKSAKGIFDKHNKNVPKRKQ